MPAFDKPCQLEFQTELIKMSNNTPTSNEATKSATSSINSSDQNAVKMDDGDEDSTFDNYIVMKELAKLSKLEDLKTFRSISKDHYEILNPIFHDCCDSTISTETQRWRVNSSNILRIYLNQEKWVPTEITIASWTNEMACMFRNLWVSDIQPPETSLPNEISTSDLITQLNPYITKLKLTLCNGLLDHENSKTQLPTFVNQFEHLKLLEMRYLLPEFDFCGNPDYNNPFEPIPVSDLKIGLENINRTIRIELISENDGYFKDIAEGLGSSMKNLSIFFKSINPDRRPNYFRQFWNEFGDLTNVTFDLPRTWVSSMAYLREFAQLSFQHGDRVKKLDLILDLNEFIFNGEGVEAIRAQLMLLSNVLAELTVCQSRRQDKLDLWSNNDNNWPKLQSLSISGYDHPLLDILKRCPQLMDLRLHEVDFSSCILYNDAQSPLDILEEYFGNKPNLALLSISGTVNYLLGQKLGGRTGFETLLRKVLPKRVKISLDKLVFKGQVEE